MSVINDLKHKMQYFESTLKIKRNRTSQCDRILYSNALEPVTEIFNYIIIKVYFKKYEDWV